MTYYGHENNFNYRCIIGGGEKKSISQSLNYITNNYDPIIMNQLFHFQTFI